MTTDTITTTPETDIPVAERICIMAAVKFGQDGRLSWGTSTMCAAFGEDGWGRGDMPPEAAAWLAPVLLSQITDEIDAFIEKLHETDLHAIPRTAEAYGVLFDFFDAGTRLMNILNEARSTARTASPGKIDA